MTPLSSLHRRAKHCAFRWSFAHPAKKTALRETSHQRSRRPRLRPLATTNSTTPHTIAITTTSADRALLHTDLTTHSDSRHHGSVAIAARQHRIVDYHEPAAAAPAALSILLLVPCGQHRLVAADCRYSHPNHFFPQMFVIDGYCPGE